MQRFVTVKQCDRCTTADPASTVKFRVEGRDYEIDLCERHLDRYRRAMAEWCAPAREIESVFSTSRFSPVLDSDRNRKISAAPAAPVTTPVPPADEAADLFDPDLEGEGTLWPTQTALAAMRGLGVTWPEVYKAVHNDLVLVAPAERGAECYYTSDLSVLVSEDNHVIGVARRTPGDSVPKTVTMVSPSADPKRRGKRGGIGNVGPKTVKEIITAVEAAGWTITDNGRHYKATRPGGGGMSVSIAKTPSDWRSIPNMIRDFRRAGLEIGGRRPAQKTG